MTSKFRQLIRHIRNPDLFTQTFNAIQMRPYQLEPFRLVLDSIYQHRGLTFVIIFSRQSGKDELIANLIHYLLVRLHDQPASLVCAQPTFDPQTLIAMTRLQVHLDRPWMKQSYRRIAGRIFMIGQARCTYLSANSSANVVGTTARTLMVLNEAQDIDPQVYDHKFAPMAASGNATRIFSGTSWTSDTLLSRELKLARLAEKADGRQRVFIVDGEQVGHFVPYYAAYLAAELARFGRDHPLIRSQYFCQEIDAQAGMFPPGRQALMRGSHPALLEPLPGRTYAFLIDVGGAAVETTGRPDSGHALSPDPLSSQGDLLPDSSHDSTILKIVEIDLTSLADLGNPSYQVVFRRAWTAASHVTVFGALRALVKTWAPRYIVIDATGVGEGLWSLLDHSYGASTVLPVKFTASLKSELGYRFLAIIESGRFHEYHPFDPLLQEQLDHCRSEILPGPSRLMRWGVPASARTASGEFVHDDDLIASSLCAVLDRLKWSIRFPTFIIPGRDPLLDMDHAY